MARVKEIVGSADEKVSFFPLNERVVVRQAKSADKVGNILLPEESKKKLTRGTVVFVAGDIKHGGTVKVGSEVYYGPYSGTEIEVDGEELIILKEEDLFGVFK